MIKVQNKEILIQYPTSAHNKRTPCKIKKKSYIHAQGVIIVADADGHHGYEQKGMVAVPTNVKCLTLVWITIILRASIKSCHILYPISILSYQPAAPFTIKCNIVFEYSRDFILLYGKSNFQLFSSFEKNVHLALMMECIPNVHFVYQFSH